MTFEYAMSRLYTKDPECYVEYELQVSSVGVRHVIVIQHKCAGTRHVIHHKVYQCSPRHPPHVYRCSP